MKKLILVIVLAVMTSGCGTKGGVEGILTSTDVLIIQHHIRSHYSCFEEFCRRLYLKNPKYEPDTTRRREKLEAVFKLRREPIPELAGLASHELLTRAFQPQPPLTDRVMLLALGLRKSIDEGYDQPGPEETMFTSLEVPLERLKKLYFNLSQVNWRLKTYRETTGDLMFLSNAPDSDGHLNMGYEVLMTRVLTRIEDDIYLRGGSPPNIVFRMSTMFLSLFM